MSGLELETPPGDPASQRGVLAWFARNTVAANLLMAVLIIGGLFTLPNIKREVFPEFELDMVTVAIPYPGASPSEVEQGAVLAVEEAVRGVDGVKEVTSTSVEGAGTVMIELLLGADRDRALSDVKSAVDRITSFPADVERPIVSLVSRQRGVLTLILYGDIEEKPLRELAERTRDGLLQRDGITIVELRGARNFEISVEVPQDTLRSYGLTLDQIAQTIRGAAVELPGGGVKTGKGEILLRMAERREVGSEFEDIVVLSNTDGTTVRLGDIATIRDGFAETDHLTLFNGKRAQQLEVFRVGDEGPIDVSEAVRKYVEDNEQLLPAGVHFALWNDRSEMYAARQELLVKNSYWGLGLVVLVLGMFLEVKLAFWVTLGIPISFIGSLLFMPSLDLSINMISLFAFIVTLGMVVDDAIIVGEAIYKHRRDGMAPMEAAIAGVREVAYPVTFSILTTIVAFTPLLFVPGASGKFFRNIPLVVICVLAISLVESLYVLPAHLSHTRSAVTSILSWPFRIIDAPFRLLLRFSPVGLVLALQRRTSDFLEWFIDRIYGKQLLGSVRWRYLTAATCAAMLIGTLGVVMGGRVEFRFLPKIDGDEVTAHLEMPVGTPVEVTKRHQRHMLETAQAVLAELGGDSIVRGVLSEIGGAGAMGATGGSMEGSGASHLADVKVLLVPSDEREMTSSTFAREWRKRMGDVPGAEKLGFYYTTGNSGGAPVAVRLSHRDPEVLERAGEELAHAIRGYDGTFEINDGGARGKEQLDLKLKPEARTLGLSQLELGRQVRAAFYGAEALRQQRGRNEIRVFVRRPLSERGSEGDIEGLMIRTPGGGEVPLGQAAEVVRGRAYTAIHRAHGRRTIDVTADVDPTRGNGGEIMSSLVRDVLPGLSQRIPGLSYSLEGQGRQRAELMGSLWEGFEVALIVMFALLAVAFRSYFQPIIVLLAIPFGMIGAVAGHVLMGYELSLMTMFGVVALSGVAVNDSLVLVVAINQFREQGMSTLDAVIAGGKRRFRPILLTSLTTFLGLTPMILETSVQARFLIPMALSLGFGVLFATFVTLLLVPCTYLILEDLGRLWGKLRAAYERAAPIPGEVSPPAE